MSVWMLVLGVGLLALAGSDIVMTTISTATAGGPVTTRLGGGGWKVAHGLSRRPTSRLLTAAGPLIMVTTVTVWLVLLWTGWTLVFAAEPGAVVSSDTGVPADLSQRAYFAGFTTFTLGVGDYVPAGTPWRLLSVVANISGLALATAAITYLVPVVTAVTQRSAQAATIASLGGQPHRLVANAYHQGSVRFLESVLLELTGSLLLTAERHLTYPILHYFHPRAEASELRVQLAVLDDALTLLEHALDEDVERPHPAALRGARAAVTHLLDRAGIRTGTPAPTLTPGPLREAGVPVVDDETFARRVAGLGEHRDRVAGYAAESKWPLVRGH